MQLQHTVMLKLYARFTCKTYIYTLICMYKKKKEKEKKEEEIDCHLCCLAKVTFTMKKVMHWRADDVLVLHLIKMWNKQFCHSLHSPNL